MARRYGGGLAVSWEERLLVAFAAFGACSLVYFVILACGGFGP